MNLTTADVARYIGVAVSTWQTYVARRAAPRPDGYTAHGKRHYPYWHVSTVDAWIAARPTTLQAQHRKRYADAYSSQNRV